MKTKRTPTRPPAAAPTKHTKPTPFDHLQKILESGDEMAVDNAIFHLGFLAKHLRPGLPFPPDLLKEHLERDGKPYVIRRYKPEPNSPTIDKVKVILASNKRPALEMVIEALFFEVRPSSSRPA